MAKIILLILGTMFDARQIQILIKCSPFYFRSQNIVDLAVHGWHLPARGAGYRSSRSPEGRGPQGVPKTIFGFNTGNSHHGGRYCCLRVDSKSARYSSGHISFYFCFYSTIPKIFYSHCSSKEKKRYTIFFSICT